MKQAAERGSGARVAKGRSAGQVVTATTTYSPRLPLVLFHLFLLFCALRSPLCSCVDSASTLFLVRIRYAPYYL